MRGKSFISLYVGDSDPAPLCPEGKKGVVWQTEERNGVWGFALVFSVTWDPAEATPVVQIYLVVNEEVRLSAV